MDLSKQYRRFRHIRLTSTLLLSSLLCAACAGAGPDYPIVRELTPDEISQAIDSWVAPFDMTRFGAMKDSLAVCGCLTCDQEFRDAVISPALPGLVIARLGDNCQHAIDYPGRCLVYSVATTVNGPFRCIDLVHSPDSFVRIPAELEDSISGVAVLQAALARILLDESEGIWEAAVVCSQRNLEQAADDICVDRSSADYDCWSVLEVEPGMNWRVWYPGRHDVQIVSQGPFDSLVAPPRWTRRSPSRDEVELDLLLRSERGETGEFWAGYGLSKFRIAFELGRCIGVTRIDVRTWDFRSEMLSEFGISEAQANAIRHADQQPVRAVADSVFRARGVDLANLISSVWDHCSTYVVGPNYFVSRKGDSNYVLTSPEVTIRKSDLKVIDVTLQPQGSIKP